MTTPSKPDQDMQQRQLLRLVRIVGATIIAAGFFVGMDVGGFGTLLGLSDPLTRQIAAAALLMVGASDIIVVPRLLEKRFSSTQSGRGNS